MRKWCHTLFLAGQWLVLKKRGRRGGRSYQETGFKIKTTLSKHDRVLKQSHTQTVLYYSAPQIQAPSKDTRSHCARHLVCASLALRQLDDKKYTHTLGCSSLQELKMQFVTRKIPWCSTFKLWEHSQLWGLLFFKNNDYLIYFPPRTDQHCFLPVCSVCFSLLLCQILHFLF